MLQSNYLKKFVLKILPRCALKKYLKNCLKLKFDETPNYDDLRSLFDSALQEQNLKNDGKFSFLDNEESNFQRLRLD